MDRRLNFGVSRLARIVLLVAAVVVCSGLMQMSADAIAWGQEAGEAAAAPAPAPGGPAAAPAATGTQEPPRNALQWVWRALGPLYLVVFLLLSFSLVGLFVMVLMSAQRSQLVPDSLVENFESQLDAKQYQQAYETAKADDSFLGKVLTAGLAKLSSGYPQSLEAMQEVGEEENMKLEHWLSYLALIGTLSPMVGLFGTVHGMISSFSYIAIGGGAPDAARLAEGISRALLTTLIGLAIAIPAIAAYNILRNRIQRLVLEVGIVSEGLMSRFENIPKKT